MRNNDERTSETVSKIKIQTIPTVRFNRQQAYIYTYTHTHIHVLLF